jgi:hypothetical protein
MKKRSMKTKIFSAIIILSISCSCCYQVYSQSVPDSAWLHAKKNIVRYNLSGPLLFGFDKYVIVGYERLVKPHQSFSINVGTVGLPKFVTIVTDSFNLKRDIKNNGFNVSVDYRFYLKKENKFIAPRGVYIGPYYSFNRFNRDNEWDVQKAGSSSNVVTTTTKFTINTIGAELGYQFIFWKRLAVDLVLVGPGLSSYNLNTKIGGDINPANKEQIQQAVQQLIQQKFPGMNFVFADQEINSSGVLNTWSIGYRYMMHIGYNF